MHDLDFDTTAFGRWLAGQTGQEAELAFEPVRGGASCELFRMTRLGTRWIIRRAPKVAVASSAPSARNWWIAWLTCTLSTGSAAPPRILSLLDFEMTTVGDPLIDLAWAMIFWPEEGNLIAFPVVGVPGGFDAAFCQKPEQLVQRYAQRTGRDMGHLQWYQAFSAWKLAIVLEGSYAKHMKGASKNPTHRYLGFTIDQLLARAQRFAV